MTAFAFVDHIYDNVHQYVPLTELERALVFSPIYQRLGHVNQLGLANLVFPGAEHTRFSHSLGVMHIVDQLISGLTPKLSDQERQLLRVAALLHDIGHLPLSHTLENVLATVRRAEDEARAELFTQEMLGTTEPEAHPVPGPTKLHESIGQTIIQRGHIAETLERHGLNPLTVAAIAMGQTAEAEKDVPQLTLRVMAQMLHSQTDADRIDYLLRDLGFAGIEAGSFDLPKLYKEVYWSGDRFGFRLSGLGAVQQFLMARLTDYQTVIFNKHVLSFSIMAEEVYFSMVRDRFVPGPSQIEGMARVGSTEWLRFNDHFLFDRLFEYSERADLRPSIRKKAQQIVFGQPMTQVRAEERLCTAEEWKQFLARDSRIPRNEQERVELAGRGRVDPEDLAVADVNVHIVDEDDDNPVLIWTGAGFENILDLPQAYVKEFRGKIFFLRRLFCIDDQTASKIHPLL